MRVSVISTVYNGQSHFDKALPHILAQTYQDFEYVIVNDGSSDGTAEMLDYAASRDKRLRVIHVGRLGRTEALNLAVSEARGEYIAQQDFDDISYSTRLAVQSKFLDENPDVGLLGSYYVIEDLNRGERYIRMPPAGDRELREAMARYIPFAHTMVMFRKTAWQQAGGYPASHDIEDLRLWIKFATLNWGLATVPEVLGEHYVYPTSYWHSTYSYRQRQRTLARVQAQCVRELSLPPSMYVFPLARLFYGALPDRVKRVARNLVGQYREQQL